MLKKILIVLFYWSNLVQAHDLAYYRTNPDSLEKTLIDCSKSSAEEVSCDDLRNLANHLNSLAIAMQINPQGFGIEILKAQEKLAKQIAPENQAKNSSALLAEISKNKQDIQDRLTIIKWLESPGRR